MCKQCFDLTHPNLWGLVQKSNIEVVNSGVCSKSGHVTYKIEGNNAYEQYASICFILHNPDP